EVHHDPELVPVGRGGDGVGLSEDPEHRGPPRWPSLPTPTRPPSTSTPRPLDTVDVLRHRVRTAQLAPQGEKLMDVIVIEPPQLGDRSYLVHDGQAGLVIDAQRDIDRVEEAAGRADVRIALVAETHIHNDYLTGGLALAQKYGAPYLVNAADEVSFERTPISDGQTVRVGRLTVKAVATPGHTHHHLSYVVTHGDDEAVFSGGSVLYGSVGRTDLLGEEHAEQLTRAQWASAR